MAYKKFPLLDKKSIKTTSIKNKKFLVNIKDFAKPISPGGDLQTFLDGLPNFLAARDFKIFIDQVKSAREKEKPIILGVGAHLLKVGLGPIIIDLMKKGWITALAVNGAFMIHDFEIALCGETSENVDENLHMGTFGNTEETGNLLSSVGIDPQYMMNVRH